jgi:hypothetical protein
VTSHATSLARALDQGDLELATTLAREQRHPVDLGLAARFLPLVAGSHDYEAWAKRWLVRWLEESERPSIERAAELAATLADGQDEPQALQGLSGSLR